MKSIKILLMVFFFSGMAACHAPKQAAELSGPDCVTGILVVRGICSQRVISVLETDTAGIRLKRAWASTGMGTATDTLRNVFSVSNICDFPADIQVGDTVRFRITMQEEKPCAVCKAYTPVPDEANKILVCQ